MCGKAESGCYFERPPRTKFLSKTVLKFLVKMNNLLLRIMNKRTLTNQGVRFIYKEDKCVQSIYGRLQYNVLYVVLKEVHV